MYQLKIREVNNNWFKTRGKGTVVAICDSWCDRNHSSIRNNIISYQNFSSKSVNPIHFPHGTHMTGTIVKIAPECRIIFCQTSRLNIGNQSVLINSLEFLLTQNIDVLNLSLAYSRENNTIKRLLVELDSRGVIIVAAKGRKPNLYPAYYPCVISIGSFEKKYWEGAPTQIYAPYSFVSALPDEIKGTIKGHSVSCAYFSGIAALAKSYNPLLNRKTLMESFKDYTPESDSYEVTSFKS